MHYTCGRSHNRCLAGERTSSWSRWLVVDRRSSTSRTVWPRIWGWTRWCRETGRDSRHAGACAGSRTPRPRACPSPAGISRTSSPRPEPVKPIVRGWLLRGGVVFLKNRDELLEYLRVVEGNFIFVPSRISRFTMLSEKIIFVFILKNYGIPAATRKHWSLSDASVRAWRRPCVWSAPGPCCWGR